MKGLEIVMKDIGISVWWLLLASFYNKCIGNNALNVFEYNHHVYTIHYGNYEWSRAKIMCLHEGGELIRIEDPLLQQKVGQVLKNQKIEPDGFWIGILSAAIYPAWVFTDHAFVIYTNWYNPGLQLQPGQGDCAFMRADNFKWENYLCYSAKYQFSFICQNGSRKDSSKKSYISDVTIADNVTDVIPGLYFQVNVHLFFPFGFASSRSCLRIVRGFSLTIEDIVIDASSYTLDIGKNIINYKKYNGINPYSRGNDEECFIIGNVRNRTGNPDDNFIQFSYGFFFRRNCEDNRIMILPKLQNDEGEDDYSDFPLVFMCSNNNIITNYTKTAYLVISSPRSDPVSLKKGKILTITIDAYVPYFYPYISAEISGADGNNIVLRPLWLKLDQVGWNYDIPGNGLVKMEVETCIVKNSLIINLPEHMANRGIYLAPNTTENDLVRFRAYVYLADHARDNIGYALTVRIYTNKSTTELETLERTIHILATNISEEDYIKMVANLPLLSFLDAENVNNNTMTIMADTVQGWTLSYYILLFMDTDNLTSDVEFGNVTVTKVGANLNCESVSMSLLDTSEMAVDAQRRDLAVVRINVSNVYNVSANESTITLTMMVTANTTITYINVKYITPEVFTTLTSNATRSINVADESCDNRSHIVKQRTLTLLVFVLAVCLIT